MSDRNAAPATPDRTPARPTNRGPRGGPGGGHGPMAMMRGEKARDFRGTMRKLIAYLGAYRLAILGTMVLAVGGTIFSILGP